MTDKISKEHGTECHFLATTSTVTFRNLDRRQRRDLLRGRHGGLSSCDQLALKVQAKKLPHKDTLEL